LTATEWGKLMWVNPWASPPDTWKRISGCAGCSTRFFSSPDLSPHLAFRGGSSLSKAYQAIHRFSEDIDLSISRDWLGVAPENPIAFLSSAGLSSLARMPTGRAEISGFAPWQTCWERIHLSRPAS
jgi:hypothetical protein